MKISFLQIISLLALVTCDFIEEEEDLIYDKYGNIAFDEPI